MIESQVIAQRDFSAGQLDITAMRADDTEIMRAGCKVAKNVRVLNTRGLKRRPGRRVLFETNGIAELIRPVPNETWFMVLEPGKIRFLRRDFGVTSEFNGMPWTADILPDLRWIESGGMIIVAHQSFRPQVFSYIQSESTWTYSIFEFSSVGSSKLAQPFYNFYSGAGITMTPSSRSGYITVNFSAPILNANHVGVEFRYVERQLRITQVLNSYSAHAIVLETLSPSVYCQFNTTVGLEVGDIVEGITSGARAYVVSVISGTEAVVTFLSGWNGFTVDESVGTPRAKIIYKAGSEVSPQPIMIWDEALMSDYRGWPGVVAKDSQRIIFSKFKQLGPAVAWSAIGTFNDFSVGADLSSAFYETVPDNCLVQDVIGGSDEFVLTDRGLFYVPISQEKPLAPGNIEFRKITDDGCSPVRARDTMNGIVFLDAGLTRVLACIPTGQVARPYIVEDLTEYHSSLISKPWVIAATNAESSMAERYLYVTHSSGQLSVAAYQRSQGDQWVGWTPWSGRGFVHWISSLGADVITTCSYQTPNKILRFVEVFDESALLDASMPIANIGGSIALTVDDQSLTVGGEALTLGTNYSFNWPAGSSIHVEQNGWYRGEYIVNSDGTLSGLSVENYNTVSGGFNFEVEVEPFIPHAAPHLSQRQRLRRRRIKQAVVKVINTQAIEINGVPTGYWNGGENEELPPPLREMSYSRRILGRMPDPTWNVTQKLPGRLTILEMTTEVTV